jgi:hypothetical protein
VKRLGRIVLNGLTVLSLLLCLIAVALWVRSYRTMDQYFRADRGITTAWMSLKGQISLTVISVPDWTQTMPKRDWEWSSNPVFRGAISIEPYEPKGWEHVFGVGRLHQDLTSPALATAYTRSAWWVMYRTAVVLSAVLPAMWLVRFYSRVRRKWRIAHVHCPVCGYGLRATPERCPECGTIPSR